MAISHLLEDFSLATAPDQLVKMMSEDDLEDLRLASFEQGYTAGWDDAIRAQAEDQARITGALGRSLEDFSFTYQEALVQMLSAVEPVFRSLVESVLPEAMMRSVGLHIVEHCCDMARGQVDQPVSLIVPAGYGAAIKPVLQQNMPFRVDVIESADAGPGQVSMKVGNSEREIDTELLLSTLRQSVDAFFHNLTEEAHYG